MRAESRGGEVVFRVCIETLHDSIVQRLLVAFQRQDVITAGLEDLGSGRFLTPGGVDRDDRSLAVDGNDLALSALAVRSQPSDQFSKQA